MPKLFPILSDMIQQLHPWLSSSNLDSLREENPFLYAVLVDKQLVPKPKEGDKVLFYEYKGSNFVSWGTKVFHSSKYELKDEDFCPQLKDPRFLFGFGFTFEQDALEYFIIQIQGKENQEYKYFIQDITLKDMAASFGCERIWFYLELNGFKEGFQVEKRAFGGRNMAIIKDILKSTTEKVDKLLEDAYKVFNFEVFSYLIKQKEFEVFEFNQVPSPRFLQKVKTPSFYNVFSSSNEIDYVTWCFATIGLLQN